MEHNQFFEIKPPSKTSSIPEEVGKLRGFPLFLPYVGTGRGNGPFVELVDGSVKLDFIGGIGVHFFGHAHPEIEKAAVEGAHENIVMQGNLTQNISSYHLLKKLHELSRFPHVFLSTSGALANETALKLCLQKNFPRNRLLAFDRCFMGRTLALASVTDKALFREGLPLTIDVDYIPFYDPSDKDSTSKTISALKKHFKRYPCQHAALALELVQGEGGAYPGSASFFKEVISLCKSEGVLIFDDEIQTFGRTYSMFAYDTFDLYSLIDVVSIGKLSISCATLFKEDLKPKPGLISATFTSSSASIHVSLKVLELLEKSTLYGEQGKIHTLFTYFEKGLINLSRIYPLKGPFGFGGMVAFTAFNGEKEKAEKFVKILFQKGVVSFVAGSEPTRVRFLLPAYILEEAHIDLALLKIEETFKEMEG